MLSEHDLEVIELLKISTLYQVPLCERIRIDTWSRELRCFTGWGETSGEYISTDFDQVDIYRDRFE